LRKEGNVISGSAQRAESSAVRPRWYTTKQVAVMLGYSLTKTKHLVLSGQIRSIKDGGNRRILPEYIEEYVMRKAKEAGG
jgi:excisionase family DNA binding protein